MPQGAVCPSPLGIEAQALDGGSQDYFHIDLDLGFYCVNGEQEFGNVCADFQVRYCCPKWQVGECETKGHEWTEWLDRDDPEGTGDFELFASFHPYEVRHVNILFNAIKMIYVGLQKSNCGQGKRYRT